jgi:hypothetical protein
MSTVLDPTIEDQDVQRGKTCHYLDVATETLLCGTPRGESKKTHTPEECKGLGHRPCVVCEDLWANRMKGRR